MSSDYQQIDSNGSFVGAYSRKKKLRIAGASVATILFVFGVVGIVVYFTAFKQMVPHPSPTPSSQVWQNVDVSMVTTHLDALQQLATNVGNGTRACGTPGYNASVQYVLSQLAPFANSYFDIVRCSARETGVPI
jgi:hypothetical protein